ncbi:hypothetical protein PIG00_002651, partial [Enterococcus faecalis]|nr:hypothetical protein [Enterococcus faecalis]
MIIEGREVGNPYGSIYFVSILNEVIVVMLTWQDAFYTYNQEEVENDINKINGISKRYKESLYKYIDHT